MTSKSNEQFIYNELIEPIIKIDMKSKKVVYCNEACKYLQLVKENMNTSDLIRVISSEEAYEEICEQVYNMDREIVLNNVSMTTLGESKIHGILRIAYENEKREHLYMMLKYRPEDVQEMFTRNRCFESIYTLSFSYPFRLEIPNKVIHFIGPILSHFKVKPIMYNYPEEVIESGVIHKNDIGIFNRIVECMYCGKKTKEVFRAYTEDGEILWYQANYIVNRDVDGEPIEIIGEFVNVQEKKELEFKLYTDPLTGCLNKSAFHTLVNEELKNVGTTDNYALYIIDLDNFKAINDNLGHQFGDSVLREAGKELKKIFRENDYVGRIGGDEFMVFMKEIEDREVIEERAEKIISSFDRTYKGNSREYRITASIGIALCPQNGVQFTELYDHADIALYDTKSRGKNGYTFYQRTMTEGNMNNTTPFDAASRALSQLFDQQVIGEIFSLLAEAKDYQVSINKALELLGLRFNAGRCYIFELHEKDKTCLNNTYEWCAEGVTAEMENLQMVPREVYEPLVELSNDEGIFYCNNLEIFEGQPILEAIENQGILSFLISFNKIGEHITSMIGFDDCNSTRIWSSKEIATLMHASKIINQYLSYMFAMEKVNKVAKERMNVLDELNSYAYIIDNDSCEVMYYNQELKNTFPDIENGKLCYEILHGRSEMCSDCPIIRMKERNKEKFRCIKKIERLDQEMLVSTTDIGIFEGRKCTFFSCNNLDDLDE